MSESKGNVKIAFPSSHEDWEWLRTLWLDEWGGETMVTRGTVYHFRDLEYMLAWMEGDRVGAASCRIAGGQCELTSLNATIQGLGIGSSLLAAVEQKARQSGARRVWLITTNDNLDALRFYQRRGYRIAAVYPGAIEESRKLKPTIPLVGNHGIPIRDEIKLEKII